MPIVRKLLKSSEVYPDDIRYDPETGQVQTNVNGDWLDSPDADPRTRTTFPARITSNPACDAGESVKDAIKAQIDQTIDAVNNAKTAFTIAGLILGLFTFGVFDIFIAIALGIANAMIDAGGTALAAALTDPVYHQFACILQCHFGTNGRIKPGEFDLISNDITEQIGGLAATILNSMVALAGEGGINNLAALGTSTGDCDDCGCGWCWIFDFELTDGGFVATTSGFTAPTGTWNAGNGWDSSYVHGTAFGNSFVICNIAVDIGSTTTITSMNAHLETVEGIGYGLDSPGQFFIPGVGVLGAYDPDTGDISYVGSVSVDHIGIDANAGFRADGGDPGGSIRIKKFTLRGQGDNPFGSDNCP